jgi:hypothetical protein
MFTKFTTSFITFDVTAVREIILLDTSFRGVQELEKVHDYWSDAPIRPAHVHENLHGSQCPLNIAFLVTLASTESGLGSRSLRIANTDLLSARTLPPLTGVVLLRIYNPDIGMFSKCPVEYNEHYQSAGRALTLSTAMLLPSGHVHDLRHRSYALPS